MVDRPRFSSDKFERKDDNFQANKIESGRDMRINDGTWESTTTKNYE